MGVKTRPILRLGARLFRPHEFSAAARVFALRCGVQFVFK
jgi:hypothetical protein